MLLNSLGLKLWRRLQWMKPYKLILENYVVQQTLPTTDRAIGIPVSEIFLDLDKLASFLQDMFQPLFVYVPSFCSINKRDSNLDRQSCKRTSWPQQWPKQTCHFDTWHYVANINLKHLLLGRGSGRVALGLRDHEFECHLENKTKKR